jgi:hypothetical protein
VLLLLLAGCAPRPTGTPGLDAGSMRTRFGAALERRETRGKAVDGELSLWARSRHAGSLPGVSARLLLQAPNAFRMRVSLPLGHGFDAAAGSDSMIVVAARQRAALLLPSARDSLGVGDVGALGYRFWSATWRPPTRAWSAPPTWRDSLLVLAWTEGDDSLHLALGSNGLPASVTMRPAEGRAVTAGYESWTSVEGVWWPAVATLSDEDASFEITCKTQRVTFRDGIPPDRMAVAIPDGTRRVTLGEIGRALKRYMPN